MQKNTTSSVLKIIGIVTMVGCFIAAIYISSKTSNELIPFLCIISGFISGMLFIGFGEIINLLHIAAMKQSEILNFFTQNQKNNGNFDISLVQEIENNLPEL